MQNILYVSFDIFDTLLVRLVNKPTSVFNLVEEYAAVNNIKMPKNFARLRINAEKKVCVNNPYANIFDIYNAIPHLSTEQKQDLIRLEFEAEKDVCIVNRIMHNLLKKYHSAGKKIILTTDMYWPAEYIRKLLTINAITEYSGLYVSNECKANKYDGGLFRYILSDLNIKKAQLIHIGDNKKSDILIPKLLGIRCKYVRYDFNDEKQIYSNEKILSGDDIEHYRNQQKFIKCTMDINRSRAYQLGYAVFGPLLYGYVRWLNKKFEEDGIRKVLFLARDGEIMQRAYKLLCKQMEQQYIYASRRALIVPIIWKYSELKDICNLFFTSKNDTYGTLLWKMGVSADKYKNVLEQYKLREDDKADIQNINNTQFCKVYEKIKEDIFHNSMSQFDLLKQYLAGIGIDEHTAIVDIGWFGNMQRAMQETLCHMSVNAVLQGYYLGIVPNSKTVINNHLNVHGYLFAPGNKKLFELEKSINAIIEWFFSAEHGSTIAYRKKKTGEIEPILEEYEWKLKQMKISDEISIHRDLQKGAMTYIKNREKHIFLKVNEPSAEVSFQNLMNLGMSPQKKDLVLLGNIRIIGGDNHIHYLARPLKVREYIFNLKQLKSDLNSCGWRIGFAKRLFKIPFPYGKMYFWIRKVMKKTI